MTDLELTKLCAEAVGADVFESEVPEYSGRLWIKVNDFMRKVHPYDPLHDDGQAMALVKKFHVWVGGWLNDDMVSVSMDGKYLSAANTLNRAIVECVAKMTVANMQKAKP